MGKSRHRDARDYVEYREYDVDPEEPLRHKREKRLKNALRSMDIDALLEEEEDED